MEYKHIKLSHTIKRSIKWGRFTEKQAYEKIAFYGGKCWICRNREMFTFDHVIPDSYKAIELIANLRPVCASCNSSKGMKFPFDPNEIRINGCTDRKGIIPHYLLGSYDKNKIKK